MEQIKAIIVEDHPVFRIGLRALIGEIEQVQLMPDASNGIEFLEIIKKEKPDLVLMDIEMPLMNGIEAAKKAVELYPDIKILTMSEHEKEEYLTEMIDAGVKGFLHKSADESELRKAIFTVHTGNKYFSEELLPSLSGTFIKKKANTNKKTRGNPATYKMRH